MANRNRQRAKEVERAVAKKVGGRRVGILGQEDISHDKFSIEVKSRKVFVAEKWFAQAEKNAKGKVPLLIVHVTGKRHDNDYVIMKLKDFLGVCNDFS
ncbi:MAG: hypothetical protein QXV73_04030 [Candidatus Micrarchaeia archaeon]